MFLHKFNFLYSFFLLLFFSFVSSNPSLIPRSDFRREITAETGDTSGVWRIETFCPSETYVYGFNQKMDCNYYGVNVMRLICGMPSSTIESHGDTHGSWQSSPFEISTFCSLGDFMNSYRVKKDGYNNGDRLSITDVDIQCSSEKTYRNPGGGCSSGTWTSPASCNGGEAICGYQIRFEEDTSLWSALFEDNVGMSNTRFYCCLICKKTDGWFLDANPKCSLCHFYCKTCTGSNENQCSSCFSSDTPSGNTCVQAFNYHEAIIATNDAAIAALGVAVSISNCIGMSWLGGYHILGSGNFFEITVSGKPQHYKLRLKFRFLKIDSWSGHDGQIYVDNILQNINELKGLSTSSGSLNFGNQCGGSDAEDVINIDYEMTHKKMPFTVKFTTNLDGNSTSKSWGIRNLIIGLYKCDVSCLTCSGSAATECLTCYPNAAKVNGLCECKSTFYPEIVTSCITDTCTICQACYLGCATCTSSAFYACSKCISGYFLYTDASNVKQCLVTCPNDPSYWGDSDTNTCVASCPITNQFGDVNDHRKCNYCDSSCATCVDLSSKCLSCSGKYYLSQTTCYLTCPSNEYAVIGTNKCETSCPENQYKHDVDKTCYAMCPTTFYANTKTGKCTETCPNGTYPKTSSKTCEMCESTCFTCKGPLNTDCVLCYPHASLTNEKCQCDLTYFSVLLVCTIPQTCLSCNACSMGCEVCGSTSSTDCSSCIANYFLSNSNSVYLLCTCVTDCPIKTSTPGYWGDSDSKTCVPNCPKPNQFGDVSDHRKCNTCDTTCTTCTGTALTCTSCSGIRYLSGSTCYTKCPLPYYAVPGTNNEKNLCKADCPDSQFKYDVDRTCKTECPNPYYGNPQTKMCENPCPSGMYKNSATQRCALCDFNCQTCSGSAISCDSCKYEWTKSGTSCVIPTNIYLSDSQLSTTFSSHTFTVTNADLTNNHISICGSYQILGGVNDFGKNTFISKSYTNIVPHYKIRITFYFLKIDQWDSKTVSVYMNTSPEVLIDSMTFTINQDTSITQTCGADTIPEALRQFDIYKDHFTSNIDIKISTDLAIASSIGSWGIYEFKLYVDRCHGTCLTCTGPLATQCDTCYQDATKNTNNECHCNPHFYPITIPAESCITRPCTVCTSCHSECYRCDAESNVNCLDCIAPFYFNKKQCYLVCPEPLWGITETRKCEFQCNTIHEYTDGVDRVCKSCNPECDRCSGPAKTNCLSCAAPNFLLIQADSFTCVSRCGDGFFPDETLRICQLCDSSCLTCDGSTDSNCLTCASSKYFFRKTCLKICPSPYFGNHATMTCERNCPEKTYEEQVSRACWPCSLECKKCNGLTNNECIECEPNYYYQKTSCLKECSSGYYPIKETMKCEICLSNCIKCFNNTVCEECDKDYFIQMPDQKKCVACKDDGQIVDSGYCYECTSNCKICEERDRCATCLYGFFLQSGGCFVQQSVIATLTADEISSTKFYLSFNKKWNNAFKIILLNPKITIPGLTNNDFSYKISTNPITLNSFKIELSFKTEISSGNVLNVNLDNLPKNEDFIISTSQLTIPLKEYKNCAEGNKYDIETKSCKTTIFVTASLDYTPTSNEIDLSFDKNFHTFWKILPNHTNITIENLNFTYAFSNKDSDTYLIRFNFNDSFSNKPLCIVKFNVPDEISNDKNNSFTFKENPIFLNLRDFYLLSSETKSVIQSTKEFSSQMKSIASTTTMTNNFMSFGSSFAFTAMMSMESIRFLKFLDIDYPPNVDSMFQSSSPIPGIVPNVIIDIDPEETLQLPFIFKKNDVSIYLFNNNGNLLIENFTYYLIACLMIGFNNIAKKTHFRKTVNFLTGIFVWNFVISYYLEVFMNYIFFDLLFMRYAATNSLLGKFNYGLAIFEIVFIFGSVTFIAYKIREMHIQTMIQVVPMNLAEDLYGNNDSSVQESILNARQGESSQKEKQNKLDDIVEFIPLPGSSSRIAENEDFSGFFVKKIDLKAKNDDPLYFVEKKYKLKSAVNSPGSKALIQGEESINKENINNKTININEKQSLDKTSASLLPLRGNDKSSSTPDSQRENNFEKESQSENKNIPKNLNFAPARWSQINTLMKSTIYGRKTLGKINPFEEGEVDNFKGIFGKNRRASVSRGPSQPSDGFNVISRFGCLYDDLEHTNFGQSYFIIFDIIRQMCIAFMIVFFFNLPMIALSVINFINFEIFIFLAFIKPFKKKINLIQACVNEFCVNVSCWSAFALALMQTLEMGDTELKMNIGWMMNGANGLLILALLIRFIIVFVETIIYFSKLGIRYCKGLRAKKKNKVGIEKNEEKK